MVILWENHVRKDRHILDREECFLDQKSEVSKKTKKWKFFKGVSRGFFSKIKRMVFRPSK